MNTLREKQERVLELVCTFYNVPKERVLSKSREAKYLQPRQIIMHLFRNKLKMTLKQIGDYFDRDHTTVIHALTVIDNCVSCGDYISTDIERLNSFLVRNEIFDDNKVIVSLPKEIDLATFISDITANYKVSYSIV